MTTSPLAPEPVDALCGGMLYPGEMYRVAGWRDELEADLTDDAYFRVVFLDVPAVVTPADLHDRRIAVYVPGPRTPTLERTELELLMLREARAAYAVDEATGQALDDQASQVEERAVEEWVASRTSGSIVTAIPTDLDPNSIFADGYWTTWAERIGAGLLNSAYPEPPVGAALAQAPLRPSQDAPLLFDAIFGEASAVQMLMMEAIAPALGLANAGNPRVLDLTRCPILDAVGEAIGALDGLDPAALGIAIAHDLGLTYPLATLFLLLHLHRTGGALYLPVDHEITVRDGSPLPTAVLNADYVPQIAWPSTLWAHPPRLAAGGADASADDAMLLAMGLGPRGIATDTEHAEALVEWRRQTAGDIGAAVQIVSALARAQGDEAHISRPLALLTELTIEPEPTELPARGRSLFGGDAELARVMRLLQAWRLGQAHADALAKAIVYVTDATAAPDDGNIGLQRDVLLQRLRDPSLIDTPTLWPALVETASTFKRHYAHAYVLHHAAYNQTMAHLGHRMSDAALEARALERLNGVGQLGPPVAPGLPALTEELRNRIVSCGREIDAPALEAVPRCHECALRLDHMPPEKEVRELASYVGEALGEQNRRLAGSIARRLAGREQTDRLDRFRHVVQVSDLTGLANVLDDDLTGFIAELLRDGQPGEQPNG